MTLSAEEATGRAFAAPKMPKCGHCGHDPARIFGAVTRLGPGKVVLICCEDCRAIVGVFPHPEPETVNIRQVSPILSIG